MVKNVKTEGAKLNDFQKSQLKKEILKQYPNLARMEDEIDWLIEEYSNNDKNVCKKVLEKVKDGSYVPKVDAETEDGGGHMKVVGQDDPEYQEVIDRMNAAKLEWERQQKENEQKALEEMAKKNNSIDNITITNVCGQPTTDE